MNEIYKWRSNARLSQAQMCRLFEIPSRTLESWELGERKPPVWAQKLIIEKLRHITQAKLNMAAKKEANRLKSDKDGNRPEAVWVGMTEYGDDAYLERYEDLLDAIQNAEEGQRVAIMLVNEGTTDAYEDRDGLVTSWWLEVDV